MLIVFCNKCGKRVATDEVERRGLTSKMDPDEIRCDACVLATKATAPAPATDQHEGSTAMLVAQGSEVRKPPSPGSGTQTVVARPTDAFTKTARRRAATSAALPSARLGSAEEAARPFTKDPVKLGAAAIAAALILITLGVLLFGGSSKDPKETAAVTAPAKPETKSPLPVSQPAHGPAEVKPPAPPPRTVETPKPAPPPAVPAPATPAPAVPAAPAPAPAAADLSQITDVADLREKLRALGAKAPREELRRVSSMPAPGEPEKVAFSIDFTKKDTHGDYDTKIDMVNDQGEAAAKMTKGDDRLACYFRPPAFFTNNARINLRIFHEGLRDMRLSVQTVHNLRFNFNFKPPDEGKWGDVVVDLSKVAADGVKLQNIVIQHIEVHGFRKAAKADQFFELSKFEIVNGGSK